MTCLVNELLRTYSLKLGSICQSVRPSVRSAFETHRAHGPSGPVRSAFEPHPKKVAVAAAEAEAEAAAVTLSATIEDHITCM